MPPSPGSRTVLLSPFAAFVEAVMATRGASGFSVHNLGPLTGCGEGLPIPTGSLPTTVPSNLCQAALHAPFLRTAPGYIDSPPTTSRTPP